MTTTPRTLLLLFELKNRIYAQAVVTVKKESDDSDAVLYDAATGAGTLLNPQALDANGMWAQDVYFDVPVYASIDGVHIDDHDTGVIRPAPYNANADTTANRPTLVAADAGYSYFDTTLGIPIWWDGVALDWVDATGASA